MIKNKFIFFSSITIAVFIFLIVIRADGNQQYNICLRQSYEIYKKEFMDKEGRIIDYDRNSITTSEGQSYIMMRSLPLNDKTTFDLAYKWTKNNLQRPDKLFSWLWGKNSTGEYKVIDYNSASDADVDIAFSLLIAYEKWGNYNYLEEALPIINSIWNKETKQIGDNLVLMPWSQQIQDDNIEINPSYFSPYAFRFFQKYDELHDWNRLIDSSYYYLDKISSKTDTGLPPNWFLIKNGELFLEDSEKSDFSYDAIRIFPRIYLDYVLTGEKRALPILEKSKFFIKKWGESNYFYTNYKKNGELREKTEHTGLIAILVPIINIYNSKFAKKIYTEKLEPHFNDENYWKSKTLYYEKNLSWFGCYLYNKDSDEYKQMYKKRIRKY